MPRIDLSPQLYKRLLRQAESFDDTPEDVIERLLNHAEATKSRQGSNKLKNSSKSSTPKEGELLPESQYWLPILEILVEEGGKARGRDVINSLEERLGPLLKPRDLDVLEMGEVRWRNRARFARLRMKELGLVSSESPRGIWEITEKGAEFLTIERVVRAKAG